MKRYLIAVGLNSLLLLGGCGRADVSREWRSPEYSDGGEKNAAPQFDEIANFDSNSAPDPRATSLAEDTTGAPPAGESSAAAPNAIERKIVYRASLTVVVPEMKDAEGKLQTLINASGGYLSQHHEQRVNFNQRWGQWVVRVPSPRFHDFLRDVEALGQRESLQIQAEEITDQYYDLEQRLKNARRVEQEMLDIMEEKSGNMSDVLEATKQLGEVRGEIEVLDGRLRRMAFDVAMSTVTIEIREDPDYLPPQAATFGENVANTFRKSLAALQAFGQGFVLLAVALAPWLLVLLVVVTPVAVTVRILTRRRAPATN